MAKRTSLPQFLPIRRILKGGVETPFVTDLNLDDTVFDVEVDEANGIATLKLSGQSTNFFDAGVPIVNGYQETDVALEGWASKGSRRFRGYTTNYFHVVLFATEGMTAAARLFNRTDGEVVAGSLITTTSFEPVRLSVAVTLPSGLKEYEAQLQIYAGTPSPADRAFLLYAGIEPGA